MWHSVFLTGSSTKQVYLFYVTVCTATTAAGVMAARVVRQRGGAWLAIAANSLLFMLNRPSQLDGVEVSQSLLLFGWSMGCWWRGDDVRRSPFWVSCMWALALVWPLLHLAADPEPPPRPLWPVTGWWILAAVAAAAEVWLFAAATVDRLKLQFGRNPALFSELLFHILRYKSTAPFLPAGKLVALAISCTSVIIELISNERAANRSEQMLLRMDQSSPFAPIPPSIWQQLPRPVRQILGEWAILRPMQRGTQRTQVQV